MKISKEEMVNILKQVMVATEKKGLVEELSHLVFDGAYVLTYNDKIAVSYPVSVEKFNLSCGVVATDFAAALKGIKTKEVELVATDNGLLIKGGNTSTTLPFFDKKKILELHESLNIAEIEDKFVDITDEFVHGLKVCKYSASDNMDNIKGMYAIRIDKDLMFSTNGYQATMYPINDTGLPIVYISKTFVDAIINFLPIAATFTKSWAFFANKDNGILACRTSNVGKVFPQNFNDLFLEFEDGFSFKENMDEELSSLEFFSEGEDKSDKSINVKITTDGECIMSSTSQKGEVLVSTEVENFTEKEDVEFFINPNNLKEAINSGGKMKVADRFLALNTKTFSHIASLKRK